MANPVAAAVGFRSGLCTTYTSGAYRASEAGLFVRRKDYRADATRRGMVALHGWGGVVADWLPAYENSHVQYAARQGVPVFCPEAGGAAPFGNDTHIDAIDDAVDYLRTTLGAKADKVVLSGGSMGALGALNYVLAAPANAAKVSALVLFLPGLDMTDLHNNVVTRTAGATDPAAAINAAYGGVGTWLANSVPSHSPNDRRADVLALDIPIHIYYSNTDVVCHYPITEAFAAAVGATITSYGDAGHSTNGWNAEAGIQELVDLGVFA